MAYDHILLDREDGVGIVTLNRPESLNAMNRKLGAELADAMAQSQQRRRDRLHRHHRVLGEKAFSAGGDIKEQLADDKRYSQEELDRMSNPRRSYDVAASPKPTIGMMNGLAYGGAAVLASSLDMRIGCEGTRFRFLAAAYGRINSTWSLGCQIGWPMAKELLFSARIVEAEEALRIGLLNHLVPRAQLRAKTMQLAKQIAGNHRGAVMGVKALLLQQKGESQEAQWAAEYEYTTKVMRGAKAKDAFPEFLARKGISAA